MKKFTLLALLLYAFSGCETPEQKAKKELKKVEDDLNKAELSAQASAEVDKYVKEITTNVYWDTLGVADGPVKVLSAKFTSKEYSNYKDVSLSYKNVSGKTISAIRFRWYGLNSFGEPADAGTSAQIGFGAGFTDDVLRPGKTDYGTWSILSRDGKKIVKAWAYEVAFSDGTKWKSTSKQR